MQYGQHEQLGHQSIELKNEYLRCVVRADLGGSIISLEKNGRSVLRSVDPQKISTARQSGSFALVPFSNRIGHATLQWMGTDHPLIRNNADEPHAIHGVGWQRPWNVLEQSDHFTLLSYEHRADGGWPFDFDASQAIQLKGCELHQTLSITNQDSKPTPVGLGWHPYFIKRKNTRIEFDATSRWEMGEDKLPTHSTASTGLNRACDGLTIDHCFEGWTGFAKISDQEFSITVKSNLHRLVVYTHPGIDSVAVEPVSHVNNALKLMASTPNAQHAYGVTVLEPGESISAYMSTMIEDGAN